MHTQKWNKYFPVWKLGKLLFQISPVIWSECYIELPKASKGAKTVDTLVVKLLNHGFCHS